MPAMMKSTFRQCCPLSLNISKAVELKDKAKKGKTVPCQHNYCNKSYL